MISIIVPVYNEAKGIKKFIDTLSSLLEPQDKTELIIVDGGSLDETVEICKEKNVTVLKSPKKGRANQMNFGAKHAKGNILYFLHSDSVPPKNFVDIITEQINNGVDAGCFRLAFQPKSLLLNFFAWFTRFNIVFFRFGDQSLFIRRDIFDKVGHYNSDLLVMEDQQIVRDIKKCGKFKVHKSKVTTSSRKYLDIGVIKLQLIFTIIVFMYYLGYSQNTIMNFYASRLKKSVKKL